MTEVEIKHKFLDSQSISVKALPPWHAYPALNNRKGLVYQTLSKSSEKSIFSSFFGYNLRKKYIAISHTSEDMCKSLFKSQVKNYIDYILKMRIFLHILSNNSFLFFQSFLRFIVYFLSLFQYLPKFLPRKISKRRGKLLLTCIFVIWLIFFKLYPNYSTCFSHSNRQPPATSFRKEIFHHILYINNFYPGKENAQSTIYPYSYKYFIWIL